MSKEELKTAEEPQGEDVAETVALVQDRTKGHVLDPAPGCLAVELPCGYIQGEEIHTTAVVREMRGYEEDILASSGSIIARLNAVVGNCLVQLGGISDRATLQKAAADLTGHDRMVVLLAIRRVSLGDFYDCNVTCPNCRVEQHVTLDLKQIDVVPMPNRMLRDRTDTLPSGKEVKWHVIRATDEEWLTAQKSKKNDRLTLGLLSRVDSVGDVEIDRNRDYRKAVDALKSLSTKDRTFMRELFEREEGSIDTKVEFDCDECNHTWQGHMDVGQSSFFFPSAK